MNEEEFEDVDEFKDAVDNIQTTKISKISLYALNGHSNPQTIRLVGLINVQKISVLIDSGSSHNFVQIDIARRLKLLTSPISEFIVATGSAMN